MNGTCDAGKIDGCKYVPSSENDYVVDAYWDNDIFYYQLKNTAPMKENDVFQIYHLKGIHAVRDVDMNMEYITEQSEYLSPEEETAVVIKVIEKWIEQLKEQDLYDNSTIMIIGDHGSSDR